jgi:hypothetical protein
MHRLPIDLFQANVNFLMHRAAVLLIQRPLTSNILKPPIPHPGINCTIFAMPSTPVLISGDEKESSCQVSLNT